MRANRHTDEYEKLDAEITDLMFERCFPHQRLTQDQWEAIQTKIAEKTKQRDALLAKSS